MSKLKCQLKSRYPHDKASAVALALFASFLLLDALLASSRGYGAGAFTETITSLGRINGKWYPISLKVSPDMRHVAYVVKAKGGACGHT